jgi:hypothetical protein
MTAENTPGRSWDLVDASLRCIDAASDAALEAAGGDRLHGKAILMPTVAHLFCIVLSDPSPILKGPDGEELTHVEIINNILEGHGIGYRLVPVQ